MNSEKKTNSTDDKVVVVKNLTKTYGKFHAVDNISLSIKKGEAVGFLGLNGAGKSTTMDMLTGCLDPTAGSIEICGHNIAKQPNEAKKQVGYLPSDSPVYDNLTVLEYLKFVCELKCVKNVKKEVDRVVEETALGDKLKKYIFCVYFSWLVHLVKYRIWKMSKLKIKPFEKCHLFSKIYCINVKTVL